jgi:hypothetical protein
MSAERDHGGVIPHVRGIRLGVDSWWGAGYLAVRSGFRYFITGRPILAAGDNATFLHDATVDYRNRPYEKLTRARWRRVARRWAFIAVPSGLLVAEKSADVTEFAWEHFGATPPGWTEVPYGELLQAYAVAVPIGLGAWAYPKVKHAWKMREPRREFILPAARVLCAVTGTRFHRRQALQMIDLPPGFGEELADGEVPLAVRVHLPQVPLDARRKGKIVETVGARLGMPGALAEWHEAGGRAWVDLRPAALPISTLTYADVAEAIEAAPMERPVAGMAVGKELLTADFANDSPHLAASGGSGAGKSSLFRLLLSQRIRHGGGLIVLDFKKWSHDWARGLPRNRVIYVHRIADIHNACVAIGEEIVRRIEVDSREDLDALRTVDVLVEEANSLMPLLRDYWTEERRRIKAENKLALEADPYADVTEPPLKSPAILALEQLINMGRELHMHGHWAGQRLSATTFGGNGGDKRASFQTRFLAKWDRSAWKMLAGDVPYMVCPGGPVGIWAIVQGGTATIIRVPFMSTEEARTLALSGPEPSVPVLPGYGGGPVLDMSPEDVRENMDRRVKLSEAAKLLPGREITLKALRLARERDDRFPEPLERGGPGRADLYSLDALAEWKARRDQDPEALEG